MTQVQSKTELQKENPIISGPIWRQILYFFFPILLGSFFQQMYNTVDAVIVGQFVGKAALAAVGGTTNVLISFLVNLFMGISSGATVIIAQQYGAQQTNQSFFHRNPPFFYRIPQGCVIFASWV